MALEGLRVIIRFGFLQGPPGQRGQAGALRPMHVRCPTTKPTEVCYFGAAFEVLHARCDHEKVWHTKPDGAQVLTAHLPVVGLKDSSGKYLTQAQAAYPTLLNKKLASIIALALGVGVQ